MKTKIVQSVVQEDRLEKAIIHLLWGRKGWEGYGELTHSGFSVEKVFEFLKAKKETENNR